MNEFLNNNESWKDNFMQNKFFTQMNKKELKNKDNLVNLKQRIDKNLEYGLWSGPRRITLFYPSAHRH